MSQNDPSDERSDVSALEPAFDEPTTEERIYSLVVQSDEAWSAPAVAAELDCSKDTARKYLEWFSKLGIFDRHEGRPVTYERNEAYFEWRYVTQLAESHSLAELRENVTDLRERLASYRETYGADQPSEVDLSDDLQDIEGDVEETWDDLSIWASIEEELRLHERARQYLTDATERHSA